MAMINHELYNINSQLIDENTIPEIDINFLLEMDRLDLAVSDLEAFDETVADLVPGSKEIKDIAQHISDVKDLKNQWLKYSDKFITNKWIYKYIEDEEQLKTIKANYEVLTDEENSAKGDKYTQYKKAYTFFCKLFSIPDKGSIIEWITFSKEKGKTKISIRYSSGIAKVRIPENMLLYHNSPAVGINELIPSYKSKTKGKFFYPDKRVYFSVQKNINPYKFGVGSNKFIPVSNTKLSKYTPSKEITYAYIDPTYILFKERSVYVPTNTPIKVIDITKAKKDITQKEIVHREQVEEVIKEGNMEDIMLESLFKNNAKDDEVKELLKNWTTSNQNHKELEFKNNNLTEEEFDNVCDYYDMMRKAESYNDYKEGFEALCKFCHIVPNCTIMTKIELHPGKTENSNSILVKYTANTKKLKLPDNMKLYHMSKVEGITQLEPTFKARAGYFYDKPRVYFTIHKSMPKFLADYKVTEKMHKYECKDNIREVYVDPLVWNGNLQGAVYVTTDKPINVEEMGIAKKSEDSKEEKK